jgi:hypothetical protein
VKLKNLLESWDRFVKEKQAMQIEGTELEENRIYIAKLIDTVLQRPTNNQEINKQLRAKTPGITKRDANLLLYLYKGVDENGNLMNEENVKDVEEELNQRAVKFHDSLETQELIDIFYADAPHLIHFHLPMMREKAQKDSHQSKYMLSKAPGSFSDFYFARLTNSAVFKDTTAGSGMKDFMHKDSDELKNINPKHFHLFKLEYLIEIVYELIQDNAFDISNNLGSLWTIPELDNDTFVKNYIMGISKKSYEAKMELNKQEHPTFGPMIEKQRHRMNRLFRYYYYGEYLNSTTEEQVKLIDDYMPKILDIDTHQVKNKLVPKYSILLSLVWNNFPKESQKKYELPFLKIVYTAKNSDDIEYDINKIIKEKGVLGTDKPAGANVPMGLAGETEDYRLGGANEDLDKIIEMATTENNKDIQKMWSKFLLVYNRLNQTSRDSLSDKIKTLKSLLRKK